MKPVNMASLLQAKSSLSEEGFKAYLQHYEIEIKETELNDLGAFVAAIRGAGASVRHLNSFYVGYKIPQIGKEFDLLKFCRKSIINIELKSKSEEAKIREQLLRNKYYLSFIGRAIYAYTFVSSTNKLYFLDAAEKLVEITPADLLESLGEQVEDEAIEPDSLFNPSDYLVSPFNSTEKFLAGEYFLTHQQEEFKTRILNSIRKSTGVSFTAITGSAGTGKTLLIFDIAKHLIEFDRNVLIIHCGKLNDGHQALIKARWTISPIKEYEECNIKTFDAIIIDEAQRLKKSQLDKIVHDAESAGCACVFSYDRNQTLASWEVQYDIAGKIENIASITRYKLSEKIRTNKEIANFIKLLFNNKKAIHAYAGKNIQINYFDNIEDAKTYLSGLNDAEWEVLRFTPSQFNSEYHKKYFDAWNKTSHQVIGQEFDGVAIVLDNFFQYDDEGNLSYTGDTYYDPAKMLFQNITRACSHYRKCSRIKATEIKAANITSSLS